MRFCVSSFVARKPNMDWNYFWIGKTNIYVPGRIDPKRARFRLSSVKWWCTLFFVIGIELRLIAEFNIALVLVDIWSVPKKKARQVATCHLIHNKIVFFCFSLFTLSADRSSSNRICCAFNVQFVREFFVVVVLFWGQANRWFLCAYKHIHIQSQISQQPIEIGCACFAHRIAKKYDIFTYNKTKIVKYGCLFFS